nr:MAG TPA: DNA-directed RNA polymerase III subunit [Caudoviricetes sp.]
MSFCLECDTMLANIFIPLFLVIKSTLSISK